MNVARTCQPVTLVNISFDKLGTIFKYFNDFFHMHSIPAIYVFDLNSVTGPLKKKLIFVVDNGMDLLRHQLILLFECSQ